MGVIKHSNESLVGKKINRFTIISLEDHTRKHLKVKVKCDCGNEKIIQLQSILNGDSKSCGCKGRQYYEASFNVIYNRYKAQAKSRKILFALTKEDFKKITSQNCFYCNSIPSKIPKKTKYHYGVYLYNGIDRLNSKLDYTVDNVVSCCKMCNTMKMDYSIKDFKKQIEKIYLNITKWNTY